MTQPHHGSSRTEVSDLRHIVDRLDLLMSAPGLRSDQGGASARDEAVAALGERVEALESDVEELRTLVNHLMTIATWQAKVTATLVDDRAEDDVDGDIDVTGPEPEPRPHAGGGGQQPGYERHRAGGDAPAAHRPAAPEPTLDDDIDEILGSDRGSSHHDPPPPDFGI